MPEIHHITICETNVAEVQNVDGRAPAVECCRGAAGVPDDPTTLPEIQTYNVEISGPAVYTGAQLLAAMGVATLFEVNIVARQVANDGDQIAYTFGGATVSMPLGASQTFRAHPGTKLDTDWSVTLDAGEAVNISSQGFS